MARTSRATVDTVEDYGAAEDRSSELGGYTVNFVTVREDMDLAPMLAGLPGGHCSCPHWGQILQGQMTVQYGDREEVYDAGDAFYMPPGHTPACVAGTEFIQFSPTEELAVTEAAISAAMRVG